jgi:hypothetical protein
MRSVTLLILSAVIAFMFAVALANQRVDNTEDNDFAEFEDEDGKISS